ncbi:MAG: response regulator [Deltaproteobacteria bacterium]|nr:response regulator [Deltaproteobacteria bacterium]
MLDHRLDEKPRILVVDDESVICDILRDFLEFEGFAVRTAGAGDTALELFGGDHFDLVLTDLKMPGLDGLGLLREIAELERDTATVIMTGFGTVETAIEAMKQGAFDYILKPFKPEEVVRVLRRALDKQRLERENFALRETVGFYELSEALSSAISLDDQLKMVVDLVQSNFGADGVAIVVEEPKSPGKYSDRVWCGQGCVKPRVERLLETFLAGGQVLAHGDEVVHWISDPATSERVVSSFMAAPLKIRGATFGMVTAFSSRRGQRFTEGQRKGLAIFGGRAADAIENARMYQNLQDTFTQTIEGFARALEAKDPYTHGHSDRVSMYAKLIASAMQLPPLEVLRITHGGYLHDIGKIGLRSHDLNKPQKLTPDEYTMFKSHPVQGRRIIEPIAFLSHLVPSVYYHHEAWDGSGYPEGLSQLDIPSEARILAVADTYDAMTSNRPYRKALPHEIALAEFKRCAGRQFDSSVVAAFLGAIERFRHSRIELGLPTPE